MSDVDSFLLRCHAYDWKAEDYQGRLEIRGWCLQQDSKPCLVRVVDFPPFFHLELPRYVNDRQVRWDRKIGDFMNYLNFILGDDAPTGYSLNEESKRLYYYQGTKRYPMVLLKFATLSAMRHCIALVNRLIDVPGIGKIQCKQWEGRLIPVIRKFLSAVNVQSSKWFEVEAERVAEEFHISTLDDEFEVKWQKIRPMEASETRGWTTNPRILVYDIETYSPAHNRMPDEYDSDCVVYMISAIFQRAGMPETRQRYGLIYGVCHDILDLEDTKIQRYESETDMILGWARLIQELDPEILSGYNIVGFDNKYLDVRLGRNMLKWPCMGRILNRETRLNEQNWESSGRGAVSLSMLEMDGRITLDMLKLIELDHKLEMFTLDYVCWKFLGKGKHDIKAAEMFQIYERMSKAIESDENIDMAKDEMTRVMRYCLQDSDLVIDLMEKLNTWICLVELSSVVGVTVMDVYAHGQQIRCLNQIYHLAQGQGYVLDQLEGITGGFNGGDVSDPKPGVRDCLITLDFASLYPSIIMAYNICYTTLVAEPAPEIPDELCNVIEFDQEEEDNEDPDEDDDGEDPVKDKVKIVHKTFRFLKSPEGILPKLVRELVEKRKEVRDQQKHEAKNSVEWAVLEARQLALKVSANSVFGFTGVPNGKLPLPQAAMSICARGRELKKRVEKYLEEKGAEIVYGDTDSVFVDLHITDPKIVYQRGMELSKEVSALFPKPLKMEFEKALKGIFIKKKYYAYIEINEDGSYDRDRDGKIIVKKKGIVLARRGIAPCLRNLYEKILNNILIENRKFSESLLLLISEVEKMVNDKMDYTNFVMIKKLGATYKNRNAPMNVFAEHLKAVGKPVSAGDRLQYLVIRDDELKKVSQRMRLIDEYNDIQGEKPKIDYQYYLTNIVANPINQLFNVGYNSCIRELGDRFFLPSARHKPIGFDRPVTMLAAMVKTGHSLDGLKTWFRPNTKFRLVH